MDIDEFLNVSERFVSTGFDSLNKVIFGFERSNLYVLGARPGLGKTTFALNFVYNLAFEMDLSVLVVSLEMNKAQILSKLLSVKTGIPSDNLLYDQNYEGLDKVKDAFEELKNKKIEIECPSSIKLDILRELVYEKHNNSNLDFLFVDDIQRISISDSDRKYAANREQEVSANIRGLKELAKELNIPVFVCSQLNRDFKDRDSKEPCLTDFRDSGSIEGDSDVIFLFHRPEYFGILEDEDGNSLQNVSIINIAKNRHGRVGEIVLSFNVKSGKYEDEKLNNIEGFEIESVLNEERQYLENAFDISINDVEPF